MKIKFLKRCQDKYDNNVKYHAGEVHEFKEERAKEIIATGYARALDSQEEKQIDVFEHQKELEQQENVENEEIDQEQQEDVEQQPPLETVLEPVKLSDLKKEELVELAKENGVSIRGTKEEIIERLMKLQEEAE